MKLVIDVRFINASGIGTYIKNVIPDIISEFANVTVLGNTNEIRQFNWSSKVEIIEFDSKMYSIKEQFLYPFKIPKCDIFWCPHFNSPILPIRARKKAVTIHDVNHLTSILDISFLKKKYAAILYKNSVKKADTIFTVSEFSKNEIVKYTNANAEKIKVVYCGVNTPFFEKTQENANVNLPKDFILYIGNVKPHKNLIVLLQAYMALESHIRAKYKLIIVGKKDGFITADNEIDQFIEKNNLDENIIFAGHVNDQDLPIYYQKATLFVFPSLYEGFGLPILEALAAKTVVLSSNAASLPEIGGDAVYYFDPKNVVELTQKMTDILENLNSYSEIIESRKTQLERFTWDKSVKKHLKEFKTIIKCLE